MTSCITRPAPHHTPAGSPRPPLGLRPSEVPAPLRVRHDHVHGHNDIAVCTRCAGSWRIDTIHGSWLVDLDCRLVMDLANPDQPTLTLLRLALTQPGRPLTFSVMARPSDDQAALVDTRTTGTVTGVTRLSVPMTRSARSSGPRPGPAPESPPLESTSMTTDQDER